jgi:hypothetical protein
MPQWCRCQQRPPLPDKGLCEHCAGSGESAKDGQGTLSKRAQSPDPAAACVGAGCVLSLVGAMVGAGWLLRGCWAG